MRNTSYQRVAIFKLQLVVFLPIFCLKGTVGFPLYPEIFYIISQWSCCASGSLWEMPDSNPGPLLPLLPGWSGGPSDQSPGSSTDHATQVAALLSSTRIETKQRRQVVAQKAQGAVLITPHKLQLYYHLLELKQNKDVRSWRKKVWKGGRMLKLYCNIPTRYSTYEG